MVRGRAMVLSCPGPWVAWPSSNPPDVHVAQQLCYRDIVALLGHGEAGPLGSAGLVGLPRDVETLTPARLDDACDHRPRDAPRVVFLGYEMGAALQGIHAVPPAGQPMGLALDLGAWLWVDHRHRRLTLGGPDAAGRRLLADALRAPPSPQLPNDASLRARVDDATHAARIAQVLRYIAAGELYQANLTRPLSICGPLNVATTLARLHRLNPVAHGAFLRYGDFMLLSNSMETLLTHDARTRRLTSHPIKGTCARQNDADRHLLANPKERAEHIMIVDLVRNDLGRVARHGTVTVSQLMEPVPFHGVWHAVSTVSALRARGVSLADVTRAVFPGGSITGAPKRRACELICGLENQSRGAYTGSLMLLTPGGDVRASILIRTLVHDRRGWTLGVGGGIVADSVADREISETWEKVAVFRSALTPQRAMPHPAKDAARLTQPR